jgi:hypothetical protein
MTVTQPALPSYGKQHGLAHSTVRTNALPVPTGTVQ